MRSSVAIVVLLVVPAGHAGTPPVGEDPARLGAWTAPEPWPINAIHTVLLPTGQVLAWQESGDFALFEDDPLIYIWDPATGDLEPAPLEPDYNIFCAGQVLLPDGRVLAAGGTDLLWSGTSASFFFDPPSESWSIGPYMNVDRYYPSLVSLDDGRVLAAGGSNGPFLPVEPLEILAPGPGEAWQPLEGADAPLGEYPWLHLGPDGRVVLTGPTGASRFLDLAQGEWEEGPTPDGTTREGGSSVLLPGGNRILVTGGQATFGLPATATAEVLELGDAPSWRAVAPMSHARRDHDLTLLPDGRVLAVGGSETSVGTFASAPPVLTPELYDPSVDAWRTLAPHERMRSYHHTSTLLPDGRVLVAGGDWESYPSPAGDPTVEVYSPPYLFGGPRPALLNAPAAFSWGQAGDVHVDPAMPVARVTLVRHASVTHSLNFDQRLVELAFESVTPERLRVQAPASPLEAPPGWYLLFALSPAGVPSVAATVRVGP